MSNKDEAFKSALEETLMNEVMVIADSLKQEPGNKKLNKGMEEHKRLIEECNEGVLNEISCNTV